MDRMKLLLAAAVSLAVSAGANAGFEPGKIGLAHRGRIVADSSVFKPGQGTFCCWLKLDRDMAEKPAEMLWSAGENKPGWIYCKFDRNAIALNFRNDQGKYVGLRLPVQLKGGEWHHAAFTWGNVGGKGFIAIYLDGLLKARRTGVVLPSALNNGKFAVGYNSAHYYGPVFAGLIDEAAVYSLPLDAETIRKLWQAGLDGKTVQPGPGCRWYAALDGSAKAETGPEMDANNEKKMIRRASRGKVMKYPDELTFSYRIDPRVTEKTENSLCDGMDHTGILWKNGSREITCELPHTGNLSLIEITVRKYTRWYMLKELHVSLDDGSGEFGSPVIVKTYHAPWKSGNKDTDATCKDYVYRVEKPGKAVRVKIKAVGDAHMQIGEIRICGCNK
jgi:hypothetical protein